MKLSRTMKNVARKILKRAYVPMYAALPSVPFTRVPSCTTASTPAHWSTAYPAIITPAMRWRFKYARHFPITVSTVDAAMKYANTWK